MRIVVGARLKAAAHEHARKQLSAISGHPGVASQVTFQGDQAFAYWHDHPAGHAYRWAINYPALPDNAVVTRRDADLISAYTLHEVGHIAYTGHQRDEYGRMLGQQLFHLWNGIEDARIEQAVIQSGKARNARSAFKRLVSKHTVGLGEGFNPANINCAAFSLALICRAALGNGNGYAVRLLDRIPEPKRSLYQRVADAMPGLALDRSGSAQALDLAREFLAGWRALNQQEQPEQPQQPQQPDEQLSDEQQEQQDEQLSEEQEEREQLSGQQPGEEEDEEDGDEEDEAAAAAAADRRDMEESIQESSVSESRDDGSMDFSGDDDEDGDGYTPGGDTAEFADRDDAYDPQAEMRPEPSVDDVFQAARERTRAPIDLTPVGVISWSDMRYWKSMEERTDKGIRAAERKWRREVSLPALKSSLYRILVAPERCGWDSGAQGGRFDGKRAPRAAAGSESVFRRRWVSAGVDTAVSVIIDLSGSMSGHRLVEAVDLAYTIADACERSRAEVEVLGFSDVNSRNCYATGDDLRGNAHGTGCSNSATVVIAKRFQDRVGSVLHHFSRLKRAAGGGTPDYPAVRAVVERLSTAPAQRKLACVITDGYGDMQSMLSLTQHAAQLYGVDVIGFGIGSSEEDFRKAYALGGGVENADHLQKVVLKQVSQQLSKRDTRRVM